MALAVENVVPCLLRTENACWTLAQFRCSFVLFQK